MKKSLLLLSLVLSAASAFASVRFCGERAEKSPLPDSRFEVSSVAFSEASAPVKGGVSLKAADALAMDFKYYTNPYSYLSFGSNVPNGGQVWQAIELTEADAKRFAGNSITSINFYNSINSNSSQTNPVNPITDVTVFMTYELGETPFYTQNVTLSSVGCEYNEIKLDKPYNIEAGKTVYFGWYFTYSALLHRSANYILVDYQPTSNLGGGWVAMSTAAGQDPEWDNLAEAYGSLCISATIEGNSLPQNYGNLSQIVPQSDCEQGVQVPFYFNFTNDGANTISSFEMEFTIGSKVTTVPLSFNNPLAYGDGGIFQTTIVCDEVGANVPVKVRIPKVNDVANNYADVVQSAYLNCIPAGKGYPKTVVVEEATGTWCGWCVQGLPVMEYISHKTTDNSLIAIAAHSDDEMEIAGQRYLPMMSRYFDGFPEYVVNRNSWYLMGFYPSLETNKQYIDEIYNEIHALPAIAKVGLQAAFTNDSKTNVKFNATTEFALSTTEKFRLACLIVEDNVGPYNQRNFLSGYSASSYPGYSQYTSAGQTVSTTFNDVAIAVDNVLGINGSMPASIEAGTTYDYSSTVAIPSGANAANCRAIVLLLNNTTGMIENAAQVSIVESGIASAVADGDAVAVAGGEGVVRFNGEYESATIYTIDGKAVATANGEASVAVPAGLYIVKADSVVAKVVVR